MKIWFKILFYFIFISCSYSNGLKIISFDDNSLTIELSNLEYEEKDILVNGVKYNFLEIKESLYLDIEGNPQLPYIETFLGIPENKEPNVEIINHNSKKFYNYNFYPSPRKIKAKTITGLDCIKDEFFKNAIFYQQNKFYPEKIIEVSDSFYLRNQKVVKIRIYPVQYNPAIKEINLSEKIQLKISFNNTFSFSEEISIPKKDPFFESVYQNTILNYDQSLKWRKGKNIGLMTSKIKNNTLNSLLKFKIIKSGLYKIRYDDFKGAIPIGIEISKIKMYNNIYSMKNYNPYSTIPYFYSLPEKIFPEYDKENPDSEKCIIPELLKEITIYVYDENKNGKFDKEDYILFYGLGTEWFDYIEGKYYDHPYTKENIYWISYKEEKNNLIQEIDGRILGNEKQIGETFESKIHFQEEKNNVNDSVDVSPFNIYWKAFKTEANFSFKLPFFDEKKTASISFFLTPIPNTTNLECKINNKEKISLTSDSSFIKGNIPIDFLAKENNLILKSNQNTNIYCRYFEIEFARKYEANENILYFTNPNDKINGTYKFLLKNFTSSQIEIFDITNPEKIKKIVNFTYNNGQIEFKDTFNNEKKAYIAIGFDKIISSELFGIREIGNNNLLSKNKVDYLIISHPIFINELQRFKNYRETNPLIFKGTEEKNPNVMIVNIFDIYDYFSYGLVDPVAIRNFLQYTLNFWDSTSKPAYVLLVGNCAYDFKGTKSERNLIPSFYNSYSKTNLTDRWFVCFSNNNFIPQMNLGRFCVQNSNELKNIIDKIEIFEKQKDFKEQRKRILFIGDDDEKAGKTSSSEKDFWMDLEDIANGYNGKKQKYIPLEYKSTKIYLKDYPKIWTGEYLLSPEAKDEIIYQINRGHLITIYTGHGAPPQMSDEDAFSVSLRIMNTLSNNLFPIFLAATCANAAIDNLHPINPENNWVLARDLVKAEKKGAIAFIGTTRNSYHNNSINFTKKFITSFFYEDSNEPKIIGKRTLGNVFTSAIINSNVPIEYNDFLLSGDPGLTIGDFNAPLIKAFVDEISFENMNYLPSNAQYLKIEAIDESGIKEIKIIDNGSIKYSHSYLSPYPLEIKLEPYHLSIQNKDYNIIIEVTDIQDNKGIFTLQIATEFKITNLINYPNPFKDNTTITYFISQIPDKIICKIYTISGRLVQEIENRAIIKSGYNTIFWDGKDKEGIKVGNGVYLYKIEAVKDSKTITSEIEKIVVIR